MSSRDPMWYCHQCHAEMRPLMVPDPVCASCQSSFVEKIEDPANDPREFAAGGGPGDAGDDDGLDNFLVALQTLMNRGMHQHNPTEQPSHRQQPGSRVTLQFRSSSGGPRQTTFTWGSASPPSRSPNPGAVPTMSEFVRSAPNPSTTNDAHNNRDGPQISGPLFAQYLMSLLGQTNHPLMPLFMNGMPESGRMGDYVFSQEALDQIITQIMESTNANRPVPATEEIIEKLARQVLESGSPLLTKDCAVCKDQFQLGTDDPEEQIIITLPCKHPFHQPCILPWLKSSGTCPVCRHALVPQPDQHTTPGNGDPSSSPPPFTPSSSTMFSTSPSSSSSSRPNNSGPYSSSFNSSNQRSRARSQSPFRQSSRSGSESFPNPGIFASLFGNLAGHHRHAHRPSNSDPTSPQSQQPPPPPSSSTFRSSQQSQTPGPESRNHSSQHGQGGRPHLPGQWTDDTMDLD